jgi:hypothetical protein
MSRFGWIQGARAQETKAVFKLLRQSSRPNRPYPKINRSLAGIDKLIVGLLAEQLVCARRGAGCSVDTETASTCRVEELGRVANPPRALLPERFPIRWNPLIDKKTLKIERSEQRLSFQVPFPSDL